jgi:hypothetical protein
MKGEVQSITNRADAERSERSSAIEKLGRDLAEASKNLESRIKNLDEQTAKETHALRQQQLDPG